MWYRTGTIAVTNGSATVTGAGTAWVENVRVGDGLQGPDGRLYEVTNVASNTSLSITPEYKGSTASGQAYWTIPIQGYTKRLADKAATLVNEYDDAKTLAESAVQPEDLGNSAARDVGVVAGSVAAGDDARINNAVAAAINVGGGQTGRWKIRLPWNTNSGRMLVFTIRTIQNYQAVDIVCSGYLFGNTNQWHGTAAVLAASASNSVEVIFGRDDDGRAYVSIGANNYSGIGVINVVGGNSNWNGREQGWQIVKDNTTPNIAATVTAHRPVSLNEVGTAASANVATNTTDTTAGRLITTRHSGLSGEDFPHGNRTPAGFIDLFTKQRFTSGASGAEFPASWFSGYVVGGGGSSLSATKSGILISTDGRRAALIGDIAPGGTSLEGKPFNELWHSGNDIREAGLFTPTVRSLTGSGEGAVYTERYGRYRRQGNLVYYKLGVTWAGLSDTGQLIVDGFPYEPQGGSFLQRANWAPVYYTNLVKPANCALVSTIFSGNPSFAFYGVRTDTGGERHVIQCSAVGSIQMSGVIEI